MATVGAGTDISFDELLRTGFAIAIQRGPVEFIAWNSQLEARTAELVASMAGDRRAGHSDAAREQKLRSAVPRADSGRDCIVCETKDDQLACIHPCGHSQVCMTCVDKLTTCPICRVSVSGVMPLLLG